ncbi:MAG: histidine--tRNA ligase [Bacillota bacterium]|nr:histidine--tRNA ligase [Bacillota bacterium]
MAIKAPKGTKDILPDESYKWQYLEDIFRKVAASYGCREIRTPVFEHTELFTRGVGETTDVVQKEMYTFLDKGGRSITLKPEGTSPAVRAFVESSLYAEAQPTKLYYFTPAFRYEKNQKGRYRQHHQFGVEVFGSGEASVDAEIISIIVRVYEELGVKGAELNINNMGCPECRKKYNEALKEYLKGSYDNLCETCKSRFEKNTLRILDCKENKCKEIVKNAPVILDYVCDDCRTHFDNLQVYLKAMGIDYKINPYIVRGLDYYSKTVFEMIDNGLTLCGGGRYDYLIEECGGPKMPAVGFGMGIERLLMTLDEKGIVIPKPNYIDLYIGSMGEKGKVEAVKLVNILRKLNIKCECDHMARNVKPQMKYANKIQASYTMVLGEDELIKREAKLKRMSDGETIQINLDDIEQIKKVILEG